MCRKKSYDSEWEAQAGLNRASATFGDHTMHTYMCRSCKRWHIGHLRKTDKEKALRIEELAVTLARLRPVVRSKAAKAKVAAMADELRRLTSATPASAPTPAKNPPAPTVEDPPKSPSQQGREAT